MDVNKLFNEIANFCTFPQFLPIEPLPLLSTHTSLVDDNFVEPTLPQTLLRGLGTKRHINCGLNDVPARNLPETRREVILLFAEIRNFCQFDLPFKLNDLDEVDKINNEEKFSDPVLVNKAVTTPSPPRSSKRLALKLIQTSHKHREESNNSFASLMFKLPTKKESLIVTNSKTNETKKFSNVKKCKREAKTISSVVKATSSGPSTSLNLFKFDLMSSLKSCRSQMKSIKVTSTENVNKSVQAMSISKLKAGRSRKPPLIDDSVESGYSSSQSSVPSPASSQLSADSLDMESTSKSSSQSITSECSFHSNVNPNGEVVYLQSQYEYYLDKSTKSRRGLKSKDTKPATNITLAIRNTQYESSSISRKHIRPETPTVTRKVLEWQSKTLLANSCPTPQHASFDDTPPSSPQQLLESISNTTKNDNDNSIGLPLRQQEQLDFDCLADFGLNEHDLETEDQLDFEWLQELVFDNDPVPS